VILKKNIEVCDLHLNRLNIAYEKIKKYYPFKEEYFPLKNTDDLAYLDMFTTRFSKLQDYMGEKLFPAVVNILANTSESLSYIDILNKLEKNHILQSSMKWRELRDLRNKISYEYPDSHSEQCETLNKIFNSFSYMEMTLNIIKNELKKYESTS
jgi:uncharacterized protein with HEPN domain